MKIDLTTKLLLLLIGLGLFANSIIPLLRPNRVTAATTITCDGELKANAWGGVKESIGGYDVEIKCR